MQIRIRFGFTFIELLLAIVIFAVGILAVMELVIKNLHFTDQVKIQTVATTLAKESMELLFQQKASNKAKGLTWNCIPDYQNFDENTCDFEDIENCICDGYLGEGNNNILHLAIDPLDTIYIHPSDEGDSFLDDFAIHNLYYFSGMIDTKNFHRYGYPEQSIDGFTGSESIFAKYLRTKPLMEGGTILPPSEILKIESHVLYKKGGSTGEVVLESIMGDY